MRPSKNCPNAYGDRRQRQFLRDSGWGSDGECGGMTCGVRCAYKAAMAWSRPLLGSEWEMVKRRGGNQRPIAWTHVVVNQQRIVVAMAFNEQLDGEKGSTPPTV